jgi:RHS repeat-associated protein
LTTSQENNGASWSQTNSYDKYGNRSIVGGGLSFDANTNRISGWSYDAAGNLLNDGVHSYTFDAENKISKVDNVAAYTYDGEGQRVRKLVGENLRFVYGIGGQEIAEFDGSTGALKKEYIYGASGLLATIEPTAINSNGTRYATSDTLGSPRVVTDSGATIISRHDFMPFGEELGAGIGGRTTGMGYSAADGLRQKFTSKERDNETGLDYFAARYYASTQGRFTSPDSFGGLQLNPQTFNLYAYVKNNPLKYVDPSGHDAESSDKSGISSSAAGKVLPVKNSDDYIRQQDKMSLVAAGIVQEADGYVAPDDLPEYQNAEQQPQNPQPPVVDVRKDKTILKEIAAINKAAKPLKEGEAPLLADVRVIVGDNYVLDKTTVIDGYGQKTEYNDGVLRPVAYVGLDQGGNIIRTGMGVDETVHLVSGQMPGVSGFAEAPAGGVMIDMHMIGSSDPKTKITQFVDVSQIGKGGFTFGPHTVVKDPGAKLITVTLGPKNRSF